MAETIQVPADAAIRFMTMASKLSNDELSRRMGRNRTFISTTLSRERSVRIDTFCEIANACGFDVVLVRGNEQVVVTPSDGASS